MPPDRLVVQHDAPTPEELASPELHTLDEFLALMPPGTFLYLDFKNLSAANAAEAAVPLGALLRRHDALDRTFVESTHWDALAALAEALPGTRGLYWLPEYSELDAEGRARVRERVVRSDVGAVSLFHHQIDDDFLRDFGHLRIHAFTVNNAGRARRLFDRGVDVILTDADLLPEFPELGQGADGEPLVARAAPAARGAAE